MLLKFWAEIMTLQPLFKNTLILRRPKITNFADVIKITTTFVKTSFKDSQKLKELKILY